MTYRRKVSALSYMFYLFSMVSTGHISAITLNTAESLIWLKYSLSLRLKKLPFKKQGSYLLPNSLCYCPWVSNSNIYKHSISKFDVIVEKFSIVVIYCLFIARYNNIIMPLYYCNKASKWALHIRLSPPHHTAVSANKK